MSVAPIQPAVLRQLLSSIGVEATLTWPQSGKDVVKAVAVADVVVYIYSAVAEEGSDISKVVTQGIMAGAERDPSGAILHANGKTYKVTKCDPIVHNEHSLMHMLVLT